ncbi:MAG: aldehyde dehydrogenase family protein, partial [Firmicutes bacterium]|nr:aldehyde dehydrogenase family protein [Bacillota bacterium]
MTSLEYAPAPETTKPQIRERYGLFVAGDWVAPQSERYFDTIDPSNESVLAKVAYAGAADVDRAVRSARKAYEKYWSKMKPAERAKYVFRIARAITERSRELAVLETMNGGKPIKESRDFDIPTSAAHFFYYAGWADKLEWAMRAGREARPIGVCGQIVPWNFPLLMAAWKIAPALACGNTVVLKPAETTPLTALALAQIVQEADLPPGTVNVLTGDGATGAALVEHPDTGSRLLVQESVHDEIVVRLTERLQTLRLGDPLDKNTDIGAVNSKAQLDKIRELVRSGIDQGATLVQQSCTLPERGYYFPASFFTGVQQSHRIAREE